MYGAERVLQQHIFSTIVESVPWKSENKHTMECSMLFKTIVF